MKDIILIAHYTQLEGEPGNNRFKYIVDNIIHSEQVELITTSFNHKSKSQRILNSGHTKYRLTKLYEPGYKRNISLFRILSGKMLAKNLKKYLKNRKVPDLIYCAVPSLEIAEIASKYCKKNNIDFVIDVQDLWPEAFKMVFKVPVLNDIVFLRSTLRVNNIYKNANKIVAVSETYLKRAKRNNTISKDNCVVYLGTEIIESHDELIEARNNSNDNNIKLVYCGTLGSSYDIKMVIDAIKILNNPRLEFLVLGDGPLECEFKEYAIKSKIKSTFLGRVPYDEMLHIMLNSHIAINPISKGSAGSIINKVADYAAAGLPVVNTQESSEYRSLVSDYNLGLNCKPGDSMDVSDKLRVLIEDRELRVELGNNNRIMAKEKFDRKKTYCQIYEIFDGK